MLAIGRKFSSLTQCCRWIILSLPHSYLNSQMFSRLKPIPSKSPLLSQYPHLKPTCLCKRSHCIYESSLSSEPDTTLHSASHFSRYFHVHSCLVHTKILCKEDFITLAYSGGNKSKQKSGDLIKFTNSKSVSKLKLRTGFLIPSPVLFSLLPLI